MYGSDYDSDTSTKGTTYQTPDVGIKSNIPIISGTNLTDQSIQNQININERKRLLQERERHEKLLQERNRLKKIAREKMTKLYNEMNMKEKLKNANENSKNYKEYMNTEGGKKRRTRRAKKSTRRTRTKKRKTSKRRNKRKNQRTKKR